MKQKLNDILLKYDNQMFRLQNQLEDVKQILEKEKHELEQYKVFDLSFINKNFSIFLFNKMLFQIKCTTQDMEYNELMKEKEEYIESLRQQRLYEIRVSIAKRTIVNFIEQYYPAWKKRKQKTMKKKSKYKYKR